jgi:2-methylcitrate dehydratase PrpD
VTPAGPPPEPLLAALAAFVADTPAEAVPGPVRAHAALVVADTVGAILGGSVEPEIARLHRGAGRAPGPATVLAPGWRRAEPWWAIVANGTAGTGLELDEGNRFARGHPAVHVWPAALAEAERLGASGPETLTAFVLGYDVAARLGGAGPVRPGMHMHGVHGTVGAAAAVARLRRLDAAGVAGALAVAAGLTLATSWRTALGGATVRNAYAGVGGASGWLAVDLAEAGVTGLPDMLTETFGRVSGDGLDAAVATEALGLRFEVLRNYFKQHACCRYNHPALDALEAILAREPVRADEVEGGLVATTALAATMSDPDPRGSLGAKFSIPYALAARLVLGTSGPEAFRGPALSDPRLRALAGRVRVVEDPALSALVPARRPAVVTLRLRDGRRLEHRVDTPAGDVEQPYGVPELEAKFEALASPVLGPEGARRAFALCRSVDDLGRADDLTGALRDLGAAREPRP